MSPDPVGLVLHTHAYDAIAGNNRNTEIALRAGLSKATVSRLRTSNRGASEATAEALAAALGVHPAAIFPQLAGWTPPEVSM